MGRIADKIVKFLSEHPDQYFTSSEISNAIDYANIRYIQMVLREYLDTGIVKCADSFRSMPYTDADGTTYSRSGWRNVYSIVPSNLRD